jgi:hypothetical protein
LHPETDLIENLSHYENEYDDMEQEQADRAAELATLFEAVQEDWPDKKKAPRIVYLDQGTYDEMRGYKRFMRHVGDYSFDEDGVPEPSFDEELA